MYLLESFVSSLLQSDSAVSAVRDYFEWQNQHRAADFTSQIGAKNGCDRSTRINRDQAGGCDNGGKGIIEYVSGRDGNVLIEPKTKQAAAGVHCQAVGIYVYPTLRYCTDIGETTAISL